VPGRLDEATRIRIPISGTAATNQPIGLRFFEAAIIAEIRPQAVRGRINIRDLCGRLFARAMDSCSLLGGSPKHVLAADHAQAAPSSLWWARLRGRPGSRPPTNRQLPS
jgi:hypothetical protein